MIIILIAAVIIKACFIRLYLKSSKYCEEKRGSYNNAIKHNCK